MEIIKDLFHRDIWGMKEIYCKAFCLLAIYLKSFRPAYHALKALSIYGLRLDWADKNYSAINKIASSFLCFASMWRCRSASGTQTSHQTLCRIDPYILQAGTRRGVQLAFHVMRILSAPFLTFCFLMWREGKGTEKFIFWCVPAFHNWEVGVYKA